MRRALVAVLLTAFWCMATADSQSVDRSSRVRWFGYWRDHRGRTADHTNLVTIEWPHTNADLADAIAAFQQAERDQRQVIAWTPFFCYDLTVRQKQGYCLCSHALTEWQSTAPLLAPYAKHIVGWYLVDEPDAVAWGDAPPSGVNVNQYNDIIEFAIETIRSTFPDAPVALNYAAASDSLIVPRGLTWVGLEAYGQTMPSASLLALERVTQADIVLFPQAFTDTASSPLTDRDVADLAVQQFTYAKTDRRIVGLLPFMWCEDWKPSCDDSASATDPFYTVGGAMLPLTQRTLRAVGTQIVTSFAAKSHRRPS